MISGEYSHTLDAKNRMILPAKLREKLGSDVVMTKSVDKCIAVYPVQSWNSFTEKLEALPDMETRKAKRFLYSAAFETSIDTHGRIQLAANLCEYALLDKNVKVIGVGDHVEIWDEKLWNSEINAEDADEVAQTLIRLGF